MILFYNITLINSFLKCVKLKNKKAKYLVGIDLGTTHTVVAYVEANNQDAGSAIQIFEIEQMVSAGEVAARKLLPSVRYHPAEGELSSDDISFSPAGEEVIIGEGARYWGSKTQGRLVTSAKSWLSHPGVDHTADILPWGSADEIEKVSPLQASASYLIHIREVWKFKFKHHPLVEQKIVITVPASFDESARALTLEAARIAGLEDVRLLEEPQAVCYDWLRRHQHNQADTLSNVKLLLICDVGGGTTDLTLIKVEQQGKHSPKLTRIGVGDHLMLGGDNVDLALAHIAEKRINPGEKKLTAAEFSQLLEQCRIAKERLLADDAPESWHVTLLGGGSKLIGGKRNAQLTKEEVKSLALDGFFPLSKVSELPDVKRSGVVEFGLPYASEPAVTKHIAAFLTHHQTAASEAMQNDSFIPDALLLNGGVFRSQPISQRIQQVINHWSNKTTALLDNPDPELSVAFGAVAYGIARRDNQLKIGGGAARAYFILVGRQDQQSKKAAICILPKGSEEGHEIILKERQFVLRLGQPVKFHLYSTTGDAHYEAGQVVDIDEDEFNELPPLAVAFEEQQEQGEVKVQLAVSHTEVGTLKIQCLSMADPQQRYDVEFQIRKQNQTKPDEQLPEAYFKAAENIQSIFGSKSKKIDPKAVKSLRADLEKCLNQSRVEWDTTLLRALFAKLLEGLKFRRRSANHERVWLSLVGYCLRPGLGYALDEWRVEQIWKLYAQNIQYVNEAQNWSEWWTLWRRIAGGLSVEAQEKLLQDISKFIDPAAARQPGVAKQIKTRGYEDMVRLSGVLEYLPLQKKIKLADWLLKRLQKPREPAQTWWALGRIGSRIPFYGSAHQVVPAETVSEWLKQILEVNWQKIPQAGFAATLIARKCGDRARDIEPELREQVLQKLSNSKAPSSWIEMVDQVKELNEAEVKQVFGEALPPGLTLI